MGKSCHGNFPWTNLFFACSFQISPLRSFPPAFASGLRNITTHFRLSFNSPLYYVSLNIRFSPLSHWSVGMGNSNASCVLRYSYLNHALNVLGVRRVYLALCHWMHMLPLSLLFHTYIEHSNPNSRMSRRPHIDVATPAVTQHDAAHMVWTKSRNAEPSVPACAISHQLYSPLLSRV